MDKSFKVFNDGEHEYDITVYDEIDIPTYSLIRKGQSWNENSRDQSVFTVCNDGNHYHFPKIGKKMDYCEMLEWSIMINFINWYESKNTKYTSDISIEECTKIIKFSI